MKKREFFRLICLLVSLLFLLNCAKSNYVLMDYPFLPDRTAADNYTYLSIAIDPGNVVEYIWYMKPERGVPGSFRTSATNEYVLLPYKSIIPSLYVGYFN